MQSGKVNPVVADILEADTKDKIKKHFRIGIYNGRGVVSKSIGDGGEQERSLADRYKDLAEPYKVSHPSVHRLLIQVSESYLSDGVSEDVREEEWD